jgi:hypothetical protein
LLGMRVLVVLSVCIFAVLVHGQPQHLGDCYQIETVEDCVATNPPPHLSMGSNSSVHCLWCHSHHQGNKARSHCAPLEHIHSNPDYQTGWVCDYRMPWSHRHAMVGSHNGGHMYHHRGNNQGHNNNNRHGRHLLDLSAASGTQLAFENAVNGLGPLGQFVSAVIYGASGNVPVALAGCLGNSVLTIEQLNATLQTLTWNIPNVLSNVATLYNNVHATLFNATLDCINVGVDVSQLITPILSKALDLTKDILGIVNGAQSGDVGAIVDGSIGIAQWATDLGIEIINGAPNIAQDTFNGVDALTSGNYFNAGLQFGNAINAILRI